MVETEKRMIQERDRERQRDRGALPGIASRTADSRQ